MKKYLTAAVIALTFTLAAMPIVSAQTASFVFNDGNGVPNAGSYGPGSSFTFQISLLFTPGVTVNNLEGLSYWFEQQTGGAFNFSITNRNLSGSMFSDPQTPGIVFPQSLSPQNASDLGALLPGFTGVGAGNYFIADLTVAINPNAALGNYTIGTTTTGGKRSVISDDQGHTFGILGSIYTISVVPDTGSTAVFMGFGLLGLLCIGRHFRTHEV